MIFIKLNLSRLSYMMCFCTLIACSSSQKDKVLVPEQSNQFELIYSPKGDTFPGPSTNQLKAKQYYAEWVPNDHTFMKGVDGKWHIIGITHPKTTPDAIHEGEHQLFHAVSPKADFKASCFDKAYADMPKVLDPSARPNEDLAIYAPYIVKKDNLYYMIYSPSPFRLAVSKDLTNWEVKGQLFADKSGERDPNILLYNGTYYLTYCSHKCVKLRTSKDLVNWSEAKTIISTPDYDPESPTLIYHNNTFYLFLCSWDGNWDKKEIQGAYQHKTYVFQSDNPLNFGEASKPLTTLQSHAPEIFQGEDGQWYMSSVEWPERGVSIDRLNWK
ncbi:hypothetical protein EYV94_09130 [Puteibacter caeruleilacunae]|nr:hypothetical protein EYV94_09130 [Puteibacter caeruleilacunae]